MALILRNEKGSKLTAAEMDGNLTYLEDRGFPFTGTASIDGVLNIDFTDTLDFVTKEDFSVSNGEIFIPMAGWIPVSGDGAGIATVFENDDALIHQGIFDVEFDSGFGILPVFVAGELYEIKSGSYEGTVLSNEVLKSPDNFVSSDLAAQIKDGLDNRAYSVNVIVDQDGGNDGMVIQKTNENGQVVQIDISNNSTGFELRNTLPVGDESIFRFGDNSIGHETILDIRNNGIFVGPNIPTADPLVLGQIWLDGDALKVSAGTP